MLNARSLYNKSDHFKDLYQLGPDCILVSETWEKLRKPLKDIIATDQYSSISYHRDANKTGGGCAIVHNQSRFNVEKLNIDVPVGVEGIWALLTPKVNTTLSKVKRIAIGSFYVLSLIHI